MHVATEIEKRGVPAIAVCTKPFEQTASAMAERQGFPNYKFVLIDHPISSLNRDELRQRAEDAVEQLLAICGVTEHQGAA